MTHARPVTRRRAKVFLETLAVAGNVSEASRVSKIAKNHAYTLRQRDSIFAELWDEALTIAADLLEQEAHRRAFEGVLKPVYQKGMQVGVVREYSDKLMEMLLKAHKPDRFAERSKLDVTGNVIHYHLEIGAPAPAGATHPLPIDVESTEHPATGPSYTDTETG